MSPRRLRSARAILLTAALMPPASALAQASSPQAYPARPIRIVVSLAPGGGVDTTARIIGQKLTEMWGQQVLIENRAGAGGTIAAEVIARAPPDGYTVLATSSGHASAASLYKLSYDSVNDFAPVSVLVVAPSVLVVHPSLPARSVKELIALAKARPNELFFGSSGNGSPAHMGLELLKITTGVKMVHVPYKGTAPSITDLIAGRLSATASSVTSTMPHANAGRLRALAVTASKRSLAVPNLPTVAEAGIPGYGNDVWYGLLAPAATPKNVVAKLYEGTSSAIAQPDVKERLLAGGLEPLGSAPDDFTAYLRAEVAKWAKVIKQAGIRVD
jgi:tripartite-type tricarboxylate transporter receptor subunit TctC